MPMRQLFRRVCDVRVDDHVVPLAALRARRRTFLLGERLTAVCPARPSRNPRSIK
jgi:hypothetical protein